MTRGFVGSPRRRALKTVARAITGDCAVNSSTLVAPIPSPSCNPARGDAARDAMQSSDEPVPGLSRLRALILLSGAVREKSWTSDIRRSVLDLPLEAGRSILGHWVGHVENLCTAPGVDRLTLQVCVDRLSPMPELDRSGTGRGEFPSCQLRVERDPADYRGTGGVLRDLSVRYDDDDYLAVVTGPQVLSRPLRGVVVALAQRSLDAAVVCYDDGTSAGLVWVRCGCLKALPDVGFVDLKEQALPLIGKRHRIEALRMAPLGMPVRTRAEYVNAVRQYHLRKRSDARTGDPFAEDWRPAFSIVEPGAHVDPSAQVHDSVVLKGGRVEAGAVVVRSVVGPDAVVRRGRPVVDQFVEATGRSGA